MQAMTRQSSNYIESVDVIEGPATGINGSGMYTRSGGTISINSKKALMDEDTRKVGIKYHSKGAHEEYVDFGTRLGEDKAMACVLMPAIPMASVLLKTGT